MQKGNGPPLSDLRTPGVLQACTDFGPERPKSVAHSRLPPAEVKVLPRHHHF